MRELVEIIRAYESDTFSASGRKILLREATVIAERLFQQLCKVVAESGTLSCDGTRLSAMLDDLRD
jgi:hypothetical protein